MQVFYTRCIGLCTCTVIVTEASVYNAQLTQANQTRTVSSVKVLENIAFSGSTLADAKTGEGRAGNVHAHPEWE